MKICKWCGEEISGTRVNVCMKCTQKSALMPKFAKARDRIRQKSGLPPLSGDNSAIEFAKRLKKRVNGVGIHSAIDCVLMEMLNE